MMNKSIRQQLLFIYFFLILGSAQSQGLQKKPVIHPVGLGWANNSVNTTIFRKNSLVSFKDTQYISFYDQDRYVVLGKRKLGSSSWQTRRTNYQGNAADAHNSISLMVDGEGFLHLSWDHHNNALRYCRSTAPGSLELTEKMPMTGLAENSVSYPEFYRLPNGDLLFLYRDGGSGRGNLVVNKYSMASRQWTQLHSNLIDGEGQRNAYWQACVSENGEIHISWVWRESPDVASNHDMCYARSRDGGISWEKSSGEKYGLPITASSAEYAARIPQNSELINQTAMTADAEGNPYIASYWREPGTTFPQYHIIYRQNSQWKVENAGFRKTAFSLGGTGTKRIPVSRPQLLAWSHGGKTAAALLFRDEERGSRASVAFSKDIGAGQWSLVDLTETALGSWEPTFDSELWKKEKCLSLFLQKVEQVDREGVADYPPQMVQVLDWIPGF